ncbi:MAG: tetratricopeptide repeat protein [Ancalomicrobiaceae bacterium]|nr:tetratricopeptide repeat protein [Ancalomicrobiaceae bacterium]
MIGLSNPLALLAASLALATPALAQPADPFQLDAPDPFKQDALPLPPRAAPADRGQETPPASAPVAELPATQEPGQLPGEDQVYAVYQRGLFVEAFALATERAATGDAQAMTLVGHLYEAGQGVAVDAAKAAMWYQLAAKRGDREGQVALGLLYLSGNGVPRDKLRAKIWFEAAAKQDQPVALFNLAQLYNEGEVVRPNLDEARKLMRRSAELGNSEAAYAYALMLDDADEPSNEADIAHWLGVAAASGNVPAEIEYAIRLANGRGTPKDLPLAVKYLTRAAWAGNPVAQNRLAYLSLTGTGLPYDPIEAAKWHLIAKAGGHPDLDLDGFLATLKPDELNEAKERAASWPDRPVDPRPAGFAPKPDAAPAAALHGPLDEPRPLPTAAKDEAATETAPPLSPPAATPATSPAAPAVVPTSQSSTP